MATLKKNPTGGTLITDLVVEKTDTHLDFAESTPIELEHNRSRTIGKATLRKVGGVLLADLDIYSDKGIKKLYPAIGFKVTKKHYKSESERVIDSGIIYSLGLSAKPNVDTSIKSIGEQVKKS